MSDKVRRDGPWIVIPLSGEEWVLTIAEATRLRDELSEALGDTEGNENTRSITDGRLTDREALVWAAVYAGERVRGISVAKSADGAGLDWPGGRVLAVVGDSSRRVALRRRRARHACFRDWR